MRINRDQAHFSKWQKIAFEYKRGCGHLVSYLKNRLYWHFCPRLQYTSKFPSHVDIEISTVCDMHCPMCYTTSGEFKDNVKKRFMDFVLFKKIVNECVDFGTYSIRLSLRGEPFIHKDVIKMIKYAKKQGIKEISTLTNNLALNPAIFKETMAAGLDWLTISFDGLGKTYDWIRQPAKFEDSYSKIKEYCNVKRNAHSLKPVIKVQSVWPAIKDCAKEYFDAFNPYVDDIAINPLIDYLHKDSEIEYRDKFICPVLYQRLAIGSDGVALLCSNDEFGMYPIGDTNQESLYDIWHGEKITHARELHKRHTGVESLEPCKHCYLPRKTQAVIEYINNKRIVIDKYINRPDEVGK